MIMKELTFVDPSRIQVTIRGTTTGSLPIKEGSRHNMMIFPTFSLLVLVVGVNLGQPAEEPNDSKFIGEEISFVPGLSSLPCPDKMPSTWSTEQSPIRALLCRRKKLFHAGQLWPSDLPIPSHVIPAPEGALLVEREKDLSTYNWNSFGLRYGKRESGAVKSKVKVW
ncbi:metastasis-suppressor KiSS-1-like isoform X1 [Ranitomeya imitator]|uniref:metastasis-suppressor KiSS-1-like isoform X1 n=1 Tax=Ranitomeya imitator TaxID=111125 RepID=UPI0037E734F7